MNIIFHFADLEVTDLSQLNNVEASPKAKVAIEHMLDKFTSWQADIVTENLKKLPNDEREQILSVIKSNLHTQ